MNKIRFKSRKDVTEFLKTKDIDTSNWSEEKWLRLNKGQAEIHMMALAEAMWDAYNESTPKELKAGEWHIPFGDRIDVRTMGGFQDEVGPINMKMWLDASGFNEKDISYEVKIATARCARVSYLNYEGKDDYVADLKLYNKLIGPPPHLSPLEHCSQTMSEQEYWSSVKGIADYWFSTGYPVFRKEDHGWCRNFRGFTQLRAMIEK